MKSRSCSANRRATRVAGWLAVAMAALIAGGASWAVVPAHCVSLEVPSPFVLPDGTVHPAGELRLCLDRNFNPVSGLHRIYIERSPAGRFLSRVSSPETPRDSRPAVLFFADGGRLRLIGYTVAANGKVFSYRLWSDRVASGPQVAEGSGPAGIGGEASQPAEVLLAARLDD